MKQYLNLEKRTIKTFEKASRYIKKQELLKLGDRVIAGISGGADSMCMLLILLSLKQELDLDIIVAHVNHGIRGEEAKRDADFVEAFCADKGLAFELANADIPRIGVTSKRSNYELPEEAGIYLAVACDDTEKFKDIKDTGIYDLNDAEGITGLIMDHINKADKDNAEDKIKSDGFTHFDNQGNARMVNVSGKDITVREARAGARVLVNRETFELIRTGGVKKGDVLTVAQVAGIMGAKRTPDIIPMCHPVIIDGADVKLKLNEEKLSIDIEASVKCTGRTGVEMEALTACTVAALTVYDMCKAVQRDIMITDIKLLKKSGGIHGDYTASDPESH
jgi:cyclic pyranopterin phosphate synthase